MKKSEPVLCMPRDKKVLEFCLDRLSISEPASVVTLSGNGKDIIYKTLIERVKKLLPDTPLLADQVVTEDEAKKFVKKIKSQVKPLLCVLNISTENDVSWVYDELEKLRMKYGVSFNFITFSYFKSISEALHSKKKGLYRSLKVLPPADLNDTNVLMTDFERRFQYLPSKNQIIKIHGLSGGHVGLIKSLYLLLRTDHRLSLTESVLISNPSIIARLDALVKDSKDIDVSLFTLKSSLLERYKKGSKGILLLFTSQELEIWNLLQSRKGEIVTRDIVAEIIWKNNTEEKYSDWAIDQVIHRIREKIRKAKSPHKILTKKGQGFILQEK